jgi:hypothetical protein
MGQSQRSFLAKFKDEFCSRVSSDVTWSGGQVSKNTASLRPNPALRRGGQVRHGEAFELGDLRCDYAGHTVIVEYDSGSVSVPNLLKYWLYVRGDLKKKPTLPIVLCHFSNWGSYGSYRDLWQWTLERIKEDPLIESEFMARQFDHGQGDAIGDALKWIVSSAGDMLRAHG